MSKLKAAEAAHIAALEAAADDLPTFDFSDDESEGGDEPSGVVAEKASEPLPSPPRRGSSQEQPPPPPLTSPSSGASAPPLPKASPKKGGGIFKSIRGALAGPGVAIQQSFKKSLSLTQSEGGGGEGGQRQQVVDEPSMSQADEVTMITEIVDAPDGDEEDNEDHGTTPTSPQRQPPASPAKSAVTRSLLEEYSAFAQGPRPPTEEEVKIMQELAERLVFKSEEVSNFSLLANPNRVLVLEGPVDKKGTEARIKRTNRRHLLLLSDALLIGEPPVPAQGKKSGPKDKITVKQVVELQHQTVYDRSAVESLSFEVRGPHRAFIFLVDSAATHAAWLKALRSTLVTLLQDTDLANAMGWQHSVFQGTYFSAALLGDLELLRALEARDRKATAAGGSRSEDEAEELRLELMQGKDDVGMAPIHFSALVGQLGSLSFFLDQGCDVDLPSETLDTALHYACSSGHYQAAALLVLRGADVHAKNFQDRTPLFEAVVTSEKNEDACAIVELLHKAGADLCTSDALGNTPLHKCALSGLERMMATLLSLGADVNCLRETDKLSPLQVACMSDASPEILTLLVEHGALTNTAVLGPRPLEILLTPRLYDSGDPGDDGAASESSPGAGDGADAIYRRLPSILTLIKLGARTTTKKMSKVGIEASVIQTVQRAGAEWASKAEPTETAITLDGGQSVREEWAKDQTKMKCELCYGTFNLIFRRHHCRLCGVLSCANCSSKRLTIGGTPDRVCDVCFVTTCRKMRDAPPPPPAVVDRQSSVEERAKAAAKAADEKAARERAELGLPKKDEDDPVARVKAGGRAYVKPTGAKGGGVAEVGKVMAETTELMHERGEKLRNLADKTQQLQQSAMDFQEMARQLAEREKNRKWWEF